ncbi:sigma factor-like helix-turn-helix DNA-binding protein [Rhizobium sp. 2YAF20]|uniref:sigma factor-like helix-turn-helix DNA-binding protein n=1 Tax=Rhizobium sp. 2YAF20 TaxID=3233027 RepID=UPI003F965DE0
MNGIPASHIHCRRNDDLAELERETPDIEVVLDEDINDDLLRLIFTACHPVLPAEQRAALALRLLGGLTTPEIARAFLLPEATVAQRIVRAKRTLRHAAIPFETPRGEERRERLAAVLEVVYLIFNEGYCADGWIRLAAPRSVWRGATPGSHAGGADARGARGAGARRIDGATSLALRCPHRQGG